MVISCSMRKEPTKAFPTWLGRCQNPGIRQWELPNQGKSGSQPQIFEHSNSKQILVTPDVVEYDEKKMTKPAFDLILGINILRELGIVLDFWTKEITIDEIILPMQNITKLSSKSRIEQAWSVNNSMIYEPTNTD